MAYVAPGSVILVTGATGAIGFEIAAQAAEGGATVAVHGSRQETVDAAIARLEARVPEAKVIAVPGDFRDPGVVEAVVERAAAEGGRLDAVVHCAIAGAPGVTGAFRKTSPENFGLLAALVLGTVQRLAHAALPHLAERGGSFVAFAADAGRFAAPRQSMMGSVYGGVMTFVRNLAVEAGRDKVRVHCISPSFVVDTPIFEAFAGVGDRGLRARERAPLGLPSPRDIAPLALFLTGPDSERITGQVISVNGGLNA